MSDTLHGLGIVLGLGGCLWFSMRPEAYTDWLVLLGVGGICLGASLALHGSRKS